MLAVVAVVSGIDCSGLVEGEDVQVLQTVAEAECTIVVA